MRQNKFFNLIITLSILTILVFIFSDIPQISADEYTNSTLNVSANVIEPYAEIEISPNEINLGTVTKGYVSNAAKINVTNIGTLDLTVQPMLAPGSDNFFKNLVFHSSATCTTTCTKIGDYNISIDKSGEIGSNFNSKSFYLKLDLRNYTEEIPEDESGLLNAKVIFWVMPA